MLKEVAEKRLAAIREYTDLGSGFKIAMRDLEIRGAGNLLGAQQSGHMEAVGYDLYCKMLHEAVREAKGEKIEAQFDTSVDIRTDAFIPSGYIANEAQKLDIYKRIAGVTDDREAEEMLDELIDRFGEPPRPVQNLLRIARLKALAHSVYIKEVMQRDDELRLTMYERAGIDPARIPDLCALQGKKLAFVANAKEPYFSYRLGINSREKDQDVLEVLQQLLEQMQMVFGIKTAQIEQNVESSC
jgi:transcription-repair coupling factor (superfamily II helicase)